MKSIKLKRQIALLMVLIMVFSVVSFQTIAAEAESYDVDSESTTTEESILKLDSNNLDQNIVIITVQQEIDNILNTYLGSTTLAIDEMKTIVGSMDWETYQTARYDIFLIDESLTASLDNGEVTEAEIEMLINNNTLLCEFSAALEERFSNDNEVALLATTVTVLDGNVSITDSVGTGNKSGGTVTITAKGSFLSKKTNNITITNESESTATLSFYYEINDADSHTFPATSGSISELLDPGNSISVSITSKAFNGTVTLTLKDFSLVEAATSSNVTFNFDSELGSVEVGGTSISSGTVQDISLSGATLLATANRGATFLGWIDENGKRLSTENPYTLTPTADMTVEAIFSGDEIAWFLASNIYLTDDFQAALDYAASNSNKNVVLESSGVLETNKTYTIAEGVRFLVPFGPEDSGSFGAEPGNYIAKATGVSMFKNNGGITGRNYAFRTLTVPSSTKIECYGEINVNGQRQNDGQSYSGVSLGSYGKLILGEETESFQALEEENIEKQLLIQDGGSLYCYGYITGSGMVDVQYGGSVREFLQICDWCGGSNATTWMGYKGTVGFLLSQYYVQNIESPLKINHGGHSYIEAVMNMSSTNFPASAEYIGTTKGLFQLKEGAYILRIYNQEKDRMNYHLAGGNIKFGSITVPFSEGFLGIGKIEVGSSGKILPFASNMTAVIEDGTVLNMSEAVMVLPGAEVIVEKGGTINMSNTAYILDVADWTSECFFNAASITSNKTPNVAPLPYVATLNDISPRAAAFVTSGSSEYYMQAINYETSGKIVVDGTLNLTGDGKLCTTTSGLDVGKAVTGTGVIKNEGTIGTGSLTVGYKNVSISTSYGLGNLVGVGELKPYAQGTYYGLPNGYWFNYAITAEDTKGNSAVSQLVEIENINQIGITDDHTITKYNSENPETRTTVNNVVALVSSYIDTSGETPVQKQSEVSFSVYDNVSSIKVTPETLDPVAAILTKEESVAENTTPYNVSAVSTDTILVLDVSLINIYGTSVRVGDNLDLYFYVQADKLEDDKTYVAQIIKGDTTKNTLSSEWEVYSEGTYLRFCCNDIAAKEMTDDVTVKIFYADAEGKATSQQVSYTCTESVAKYAKRTLQNEVAKNNDELITVLVDMLNYGASCQTYFTYKDDASQLANVGIESYQEEYAGNYGKAWTAISNDVDLGYSANVTAESKLVFSFYFATSAIQATDATVTYRDHYGNDIVKTITPIVEDGQYRIKVEGLAVADGRQQITCTVKTINDKEVSIASSIESYVATIENDNSKWDVVFRDLMYFVDSAYEYFH